MRYGSVCSGIEAATVAWEPLGWEPAFFSEVARFPRAVLKHHYPHVPLHGDFTTIKASEYGPIDLLVGGTPCFPAGTMIATEKGFLEIEKVAVGDKLLTHTGQFRTVLRTGCKISETVRVTGQGHFGLVTTANHRFLARHKHRKSTRINGKAAHVCHVSHEQWIAASDLVGKHWACVADWPASVCPPIEQRGHETAIPEISADLFRLAGAYLGDGWATTDTRHGYAKFGISKPKLDKLKPTFDAIGAWSSTEDRTTIRVQLSSRPLARWLIEHFGSGAAAKHVPMWALGQPLEYRQALIEGYLITDGGRAETVGMRATTISKQLALTMRMLAVSCGYASSVGFSKRPAECKIEGRTVHQSDTYTVSFSPSKRTSFHENGFRWQLVRKVEPTGHSEEVYDLEVAEDHSYVADGIAVHNCQSFSVAGLRGGMDDERGNLALEFLRLAGRLRPRWILWENVPGVLSSNSGRDFGSFLGGLGELGYGFAYRCLDAQYFGLAQRRLRVFVVGYVGDWRRAAAVLFEPESLRWDSPPRRQSRQDVAPTISARTRSGGGLGTDFDLDGGLITAIQERAISENPVAGPDGIGVRTDGLAYTLEARSNVQAVAFGGNNSSGPIDIATALNASHTASGRQDFDSETFITHALRADGFDASEDGTGRGTPIVPVAFSCKDHGADAREIAPTLRAMGFNKSHANAGGQVAIAFAQNTRDEVRKMPIAGALASQPGMKQQSYVMLPEASAVALRGREGGATAELGGDISHAIHASTGGSDKAHILTHAVRRLTPTECERLQGFPDNYTRIPIRHHAVKRITKLRPADMWKPASDGGWHLMAADGPRYMVLGNSMAVPVMHRIGERIAIMEAIINGEAWAPEVLTGDCRQLLDAMPTGSVQCCVTSPPYFGLRDYGVAGQIGLEPTPDEYIAEMVAVFRKVHRVLRDDGTLWLNLGDSYASGGRKTRGYDKKLAARVINSRPQDGAKPKDLLMIPARVALALQADGWWLRSDIIWHKANSMPESVTDRPTCAHEHVFLLTKRATYFYNADAIREPMATSSIARLAQNLTKQAGSHRANGGAKTNGPMKAVGRADKQRGHSRRHTGFNDRWDAIEKSGQRANGANARNVWTIAPAPFSEAHFATFPPALAERCIKAGTRPGDTVLDPFGGAGTTGLVADRLQRDAILIELNPQYVSLARKRIAADRGPLSDLFDGIQQNGGQ